MSFWDKLTFWDNDDKKPSTLEKERESWGTEPSPDILRRSAAQPRQPAPGTPAAKAAPVLATWSNPREASQPTQRYLRAAGWKGAPSRSQAYNSALLDPGSLKTFDPHSYSLTPWQQEQAEIEYGVKVPEQDLKLRGDAYRVGKMNAADYELLNDKQKKAVKFNELLMAAVESDRRTSVAPEEQNPEYQARVSEMFGTQGGSNVYAPRTMDLLDKLGMGRLRGQDLDEYLSLDRAYDTNEVAALQPWDVTPEVPKYENFAQARTTETESLIDRRQIDQVGPLIEAALADISITGWNEDARIAQYLGNRPPPDQIPFGWLTGEEGRSNEGDTKKELLFQNMYDYLSTNTTDSLDQLWEATDQYKFNDADFAELYDYFYLKTLEDDRIGTDANHRTGQQTRDFIGLGG